MARRGDGIYLRGKTWWLDFTHKGRRHVARLGKGIPVTAARELAVVRRVQILKGEVGIGEGSSVTLAAYAKTWLAKVTPDLETASVTSYAGMLRLHLLPALGGVKLPALERKHVKQLLEAKRAGLSKNTVRLIRATLSVILADALEDGLIKLNPAQGLTRRGRRGPGTVTQADRQQQIEALSVEHLATFLETARAKCSRRDATLFLTLADAGLRPGEALALRWEDLVLARRTLRVTRALSGQNVKATKTGRERDVDLTTRLAEALKGWQAQLEAEALMAEPIEEPSPWMFADGDRLLDELAVNKRFGRVSRAAGLPHHRLYDLRHTFASHLLAAGAPITYVAAQLGHRKPTTTLAHYAHWLPTGDRAWADRLEQAREGEGAGAFPNAFHNAAV